MQYDQISRFLFINLKSFQISFRNNYIPAFNGRLALFNMSAENMLKWGEVGRLISAVLLLSFAQVLIEFLVLQGDRINYKIPRGRRDNGFLRTPKYEIPLWWESRNVVKTTLTKSAREIANKLDQIKATHFCVHGPSRRESWNKLSSESVTYVWYTKPFNPGSWDFRATAQVIRIFYVGNKLWMFRRPLHTIT